jgi:hypothetical protein
MQLAAAVPALEFANVPSSVFSLLLIAFDPRLDDATGVD